MAANKKEYTLVINGVSENIKDVTTLTDRVKELDGELGKTHGINTKATAASRERTKALTEEEKAERKLKETIGKVAQAKSEQNRQQIEANQALREATREATLRARAENAAEGSIEQMRAKLSLLNSEWTKLDVGSEAFQKMSAEILQLNEDIKRAEESTGDFRRSVGNYEKATAGLETFGKGLSGVTQIGKGLTSVFLSANVMLGLFGDRSEENAKQAQQLQKILALLTLVQSAGNTLLKDGIILKAKSAALDKVQAVQIKAKAAAEAAATKNTIAATAAQKIYNAIASANPYVLLVAGLLSVVGAFALFIKGAKDAAIQQKTLNDLEQNYLDLLDLDARKVQESANRKIDDLTRQLEVAKSQGKSLSEIYALEDQINAVRRKATSWMKGQYGDMVNGLEANRKKLEDYLDLLNQVERFKAQGDKNILFGVNLDGNMKKTDIDEAISQAQAKVDEYKRKIEIGTKIVTDEKELDAQAKIIAADRAKAAREAAKVELDIIRQSEDAKVKTIRDANEQARKQTAAQYDRQIEDIRRRLATETNLTATARKALNATIESLETQKGQALAGLQKEQDAKTRELQREAEDIAIARIKDGFTRERAERLTAYERQKEDLERRLADDITLTEDQRTAIREIIARSEAQLAEDMDRIRLEELDRTNELALSRAELFADQWQQRIGKLVVRKKGNEFGLIDVEATRKKLATANMYLTQYIGMVQSAQKQETDAHNERLKGLKKGTPEYEEEMQRYGRAILGFAQKVDEAQDQIKRNTETSTNILLENYEKVAQRVQEIGQAVIQAASITSEAIQNEVQYKIDALNAQLDALDERYQKTVEANEAHKDRIKEIEAELQDATGGTAEALRAQLEDQMHAQAEAAREEARLAKEKERLQMEIDKKEKQMKRAQLVSDITQGIANTASAVIGALGNKPWGPWNFALAAIVGAMGAAQTGIMMRQLTKLADGGLIVGPSHAKGGARIHGTNIEVEGGEFVVNKASYAANAELVRYINDARGPISSGEAMGFMPRETTPVPINLPPLFDADDIIEAIHGIDIRPVVSVVDIADVSDQVTRVRDIAGA